MILIGNNKNRSRFVADLLSTVPPCPKNKKAVYIKKIIRSALQIQSNFLMKIMDKNYNKLLCLIALQAKEDYVWQKIYWNN